MSGKSYATPASVYEQAANPAYGAPPPAYGSAPVVVDSYAAGGAAPVVVQSSVVSGTVLQAQPIAAAPMVVTVPQGMKSGMALQVAAPDGRAMQVTIPPNLGPGMQFQVQFPPPAHPVGAVVGVGPPVAVQGYVNRPVSHVTAATKRCRGCGVQFELDAKTNPASAAAFRCKNCRGLKLSSFF